MTATAPGRLSAKREASRGVPFPDAGSRRTAHLSGVRVVRSSPSATGTSAVSISGQRCAPSPDSIRTRRRMAAEEAAQKTTIKILFPLVLMILPAMLLIITGPATVQKVRTLSF